MIITNINIKDIIMIPFQDEYKFNIVLDFIYDNYPRTTIEHICEGYRERVSKEVLNAVIQNYSQNTECIVLPYIENLIHKLEKLGIIKSEKKDVRTIYDLSDFLYTQLKNYFQLMELSTH